MDKALEFLNGNYNMILNDLQKKMEEAAEALEFEEAARYRDLFNSVKQVSQKQKNHGQRRGGQGHLRWTKTEADERYRCFLCVEASDGASIFI